MRVGVYMNSLHKGLLVSAVLLSQLLLNPHTIASEEYNNTNEAVFSEAELAQILAPIALYPDSLLTHVVIASTYPLEVVEAFRWREKNSTLDASQATERAQNLGWDPSIVALVAFPNVLARLNDDITWTQNLGNAFLEDEERVLDTIQVLREQAMQANSLDNLQNMTVTKVNRQIIIQPTQKEVVYVPYYDTRVVYGNWYWHRYPPVFWTPRSHLSVHFPTRISGLFHWNRGINISFNYHFSAFKWANRHIVVTAHHKTRQHRSHTRIASSNGAKRWTHKPSHRRGIAYRSDRLNSRYHGHKSSTVKKRFIAGVNNHRQDRKYDKKVSAARSHLSARKQNKRNNHRSITDKLVSNSRDNGSSYKEKNSSRESKYFKRGLQEKYDRSFNRTTRKVDSGLVDRSHNRAENYQQRQNHNQLSKQKVAVNRAPVKKQRQVQNKKLAKIHSQKEKKQKTRKRKKD